MSASAKGEKDGQAELGLKQWGWVLTRGVSLLSLCCCSCSFRSSVSLAVTWAGDEREREREREMKQSKLRTFVPMNLRLKNTKERHSR